MQIRKDLETFNYSPAPEDYHLVKRTREEKKTLDNGAQYEGEWDTDGKKDGQGV